MNNLHNEESKFTIIDENDYISSTANTLFGILATISIIVWVIWSKQNDFEIISSIFKAIFLIFITHYGSTIPTAGETEELNRKKELLQKQNKQYVLNKTNEILYKNGFKNLSKEIIVNFKDIGEGTDYTSLIGDERYTKKDFEAFDEEFKTYYNNKFIINDIDKIFGYIHYEINETNGNEKYYLNTATYNELLDYEVIDKTTLTQIATSKTSSNSGKAIGGAIVSNLLFGNATVGAVVGGSGARTTETTTKTNKDENYQINIYVNNLQNSIIKIETTSREVISEIISILEIIISQKELKIEN